MAEYFRDDERLDVLMLIDNIFRFIQAGSEAQPFFTTEQFTGIPGKSSVFQMHLTAASAFSATNSKTTLRAIST